MRIPFYDLRSVNARFEVDFLAVQARILQSGWYLLGDETRSFENEFAAFTGAAHCICVANGYDALRLTLEAWISLGQLARGDEVIVPANSFVASAMAVTHAGLRPRLADVDPRTYNATAKTIADAITPATRAVMPVHLFGQLADVEGIGELCRSRRLLMLEDAAQAHGARLDRRTAGTFGDAGAYSFYPAKNLGALGDAGCVVTASSELAERVRILANYGAARKYEHTHLGANSRIDEIQAAFLRPKLKRLSADNVRRREIAHRYCHEIIHPLIELPANPKDPASHVWHLYVICTLNRKGLTKHLASREIDVMIHYPRAIHRQPAYEHAGISCAMLSTVERLQHQILSLPISPVMSDEQVTYVINAINAWPEYIPASLPI